MKPVTQNPSVKSASEFSNLATSAALSVYDAVTLSNECRDKISTLLKAIAEQPDNPRQTQGLAEIGLYLIEDWTLATESDLDALEEVINQLKSFHQRAAA